jgi:hypothetical protein
MKNQEVIPMLNQVAADTAIDHLTRKMARHMRTRIARWAYRGLYQEKGAHGNGNHA